MQDPVCPELCKPFIATKSNFLSMTLLSSLQQRNSLGESLAVTDRLGAFADGALILSGIVTVAIFTSFLATIN